MMVYYKLPPKCGKCAATYKLKQKRIPQNEYDTHIYEYECQNKHQTVSNFDLIEHIWLFEDFGSDLHSIEPDAIIMYIK